MPDFVLIIDAGSFGKKSRIDRFYDFQDTDDLSFSTHSLPPSVLGFFG
jgi:hypothetical protein